MPKVIRFDGKEGTDFLGHLATRLDDVATSRGYRFDTAGLNLSVWFQRQLEYIESDLNFVEYGELSSWKHIPIETKGGDNKWYTWRLFDKVGKWKIGGTDADDVPEVNIMGAELPVPIRPLTGGFKYNVQELLDGKQAAQNNPNAPSIMIEQQKATACMEAYQQLVDQICWFANPSSPVYAGLTGIFYNTYIPTVSAALGTSSSKTTWFNSLGVPQKTPDEVLVDLNAPLTAIRVNTLNRYSADAVLMPIQHFNYMANTRIQDVTGKTILTFWLETHPEITTLDICVPCLNVPAGGNLATATDVILYFKKSADVVKLVLPRQFTMQPIQEVGFNYKIPCWATTAGVITKRPKAMAMLIGTSTNAVGS